MKIKLVCIGRLRSAAVEELVSSYASRIDHYYPFELTVVPDVRLRAADAARQKEAEGEKILGELAPGDRLMLLDERGREYTSRELSGLLDKLSVDGCRRLVLVIGGPYGFSKAVYDRADAMLSLSRLTLPHELARLFTVEQLYRAGTISRGEPYHHD